MLDGLLTATALWVTPISTHARFLEIPNIPVPIGLDTWSTRDVWSIPFYTNADQATLRPILYSPAAWQYVANGSWKRWGNSAAVEAQILASSHPDFPYPGNVYSSISATSWVLPNSFNKLTNPKSGPAYYHFAATLTPAAGPDGHIAVVQPNGQVFESYGTIVLSSGQVVALSYAVSDPTALGDGYQNGQTASMIPCYQGVLDDIELSAGAISHALAIVLPPGLLATAAVLPAYTFDRDAITASPPYSGRLPMGSRLGLPPSVAVSSLGLTTSEGTAIAMAAQKYGLIAVDRGGSGITIRVRHNSPTPNPILHTWNSALQADLNKIESQLKLVE